MNSLSISLFCVAAVILGRALPTVAQTDYYNTDTGRPVRIEDAFPVERYAFEGQIAPIRLERSDDGAYHWEFEPELAYGIFPGTHLEAGIHLDLTDQNDAGRKLGLSGVEVALLHNLNVETRTWPAFGLVVDALVPLGDFEGDGIYPSVEGIVTRTFRAARVHLNGRYSMGAMPAAGGGPIDLSRWMAGVAVDRAFPLRGALLIADVFMERPMDDAHDIEWTAEIGARYQLDPFFALDVGTGRRLTGDAQAWFVTFGAARTFGFRSLMPSR